MNPEEINSRLQAAEAKAWWRDMVGLVSPTDVHLAVIRPRADITPEALRQLGEALNQWKLEFAQARHIWGLSDLLNGQFPRTPPIYLAVPFPIDRYEECYEPVALVFVAAGTDRKAAIKTLSERLKKFQSLLAWFDSPEGYCYAQR